jgi:hypothetical protein
MFRKLPFSKIPYIGSKIGKNKIATLRFRLFQIDLEIETINL